jgi:hypothetical protein
MRITLFLTGKMPIPRRGPYAAKKRRSTNFAVRVSRTHLSITTSCTTETAAPQVAPKRVGRKEKLPEKVCPRGAKDTARFRERLDARPPRHAFRRHGPMVGRNMFSEAGRRHPCQRTVASRSAGVSSSRYSQVQTHPRGSILEVPRIGHLPNRVKADFFPRNPRFSAVSEAFSRAENSAKNRTPSGRESASRNLARDGQPRSFR